MLTRPSDAVAAPSPPSPAAGGGRDLNRIASFVLGVALLAPLVVYGMVGAFTRYAADDYCTAGVLRTQGLLGAQTWWYFGFSPRYAFSFAVSVVELFGLAIVPILPTLAMIGWWLALTWMLRQFTNIIPRLRSLLAAGLIAEVIVFATLSTAPDLPQSLYWQTGMLTYLFPLILLALYVGWVQRQVARVLRGEAFSPWTLILSAGIPFIAGGMSETYLALQGMALFLGLVACFVVRTPAARAARPHLVAGWLASLLALGIIQLSPTVNMREAGLKPPVWLAIQAAANTGWFFTVRFIRHSLPTALLCLIVPALVGIDYRQRWSTRTLAAIVLGTTAVSLGLVMGVFFPAFFAQGGDPPARSLIEASLTIVCYFVGIGVLLAPNVRALVTQRAPRHALAGAALVLALVPLSVAAQTLPDRTTAADYAARWDSVDRQIRTARAAGTTDLVVPQLPLAVGEPFVTTNARDWFNQCVARYYDLNTIVADTPPPGND
jgi:hypothetical protein